MDRTWDLQDSENILYDTIMVDVFHYKFIQVHKMYHTKGEP